MAQSKLIGDLKIPVGTYPAKQNGQEVTKRRYREIGTVLEITYDSGHTSTVAKLNIEILSMELQVLLRANGLIAKGDDAILCNVYSREPKQSGAAGPGQNEPDPANEEPGPF